MPDSENPNAPVEQIDEVPGLPRRQFSTYARLWQLETWLRHMVYVELRALHGDRWSAGINADGNLDADKRLIHMPTPEKDPLSYITFSQLTRLVSENWETFNIYLPPKSIWAAKLEEVGQIRNRVAHFRLGHADDHRRVVQLLRDLDRPFWKFCTSYNNSYPILPSSDDAVTAHFLRHDPFPWTEVDGKKWVRVGSAPRDMIVSVTVEVLRRPWAMQQAKVDGTPGYLYDVQLVARDGRHFDYVKFLESTAVFHDHLVHFCLSKQENLVRLTIPALLGVPKIVAIVERALKVAGYVIDRGPRWPTNPSAQALADQWPEFVLGPDNPLTFLTPDMECTFFTA